MPLTSKGRELLKNFKQEYGPNKGKEVFYAAANKGTIKGVHEKGKSDGNEQGQSSRKHRSKASKKGS